MHLRLPSKFLDDDKEDSKHICLNFFRIVEQLLQNLKQYPQMHLHQNFHMK